MESVLAFATLKALACVGSVETRADESDRGDLVGEDCDPEEEEEEEEALFSSSLKSCPSTVLLVEEAVALAEDAVMPASDTG